MVSLADTTPTTRTHLSILYDRIKKKQFSVKKKRSSRRLYSTLKSSLLLRKGLLEHRCTVIREFLQISESEELCNA